MIVDEAATKRCGALRFMIPTVSVITATHNRLSMLSEAVSSLQAQTRGDYEHLIYNDASTDETAHYLQVTSLKDSRIRDFSRRPPNTEQPAKLWNDLLDQAVGEYLCFMDDDNPKEPRFIEVMAGELDKDQELDMVTCGFIYHENGKTEENHTNLQTASLIGERNTVDTGAIMIRRSAMDRLGYFPLDIRTNEDWALVRRAVQGLKKIKHLPDCLTHYVVHDGMRMKRYADTNQNRQDKHRVQWGSEYWYGDIGVKFYAPANLSDSASKMLESRSKIPWLKEGIDWAVIFLEDMSVESVSAAIRSANSSLLISFGGNVQKAIDFAKSVAGEKVQKTRLAIGGRQESELHECDFGGRLISFGAKAAPAYAYAPEVRLGRIINAARSLRFNAMVP